MPGNATSYVDTTLNTGYYRVCVYNGSYISGYSNYVQREQRAGDLRRTRSRRRVHTTASGVTTATRARNYITNCNAGNWAEYAGVNFPAGVNPAGLKTAINQITVCYSSTAAGDNNIEFYTDSTSTGTLLGSVTTQCDPAGGLFTTTIDIGDLARRQQHRGRPPQRLHRLSPAPETAARMSPTSIGSRSPRSPCRPCNNLRPRITPTPAPPAAALRDGNRELGPILAGPIYCDNGDWVQYANVYIPAGVNQVRLNYTAPAARAITSISTWTALQR